MPIVAPLLSNFGGGEFSPQAQGRTDTDKYKTGADLIENWVPLVEGGMTARPGSKFVWPTKYRTKVSRLIRFKYSTLAAYMIEAGDQYFRFHKNNQVVTYTPVTVTAATKANPCKITAAGHGLSNGNRFKLNIVGMTELNGREFIASGVSGNDVNLTDVDGNNVNSTAYTTFSSGTVAKIYELATSYLEAEVFGIKFAGESKNLRVTHPNHRDKKLVWTSDTSWTLEDRGSGPFYPTVDSASNTPFDTALALVFGVPAATFAILSTRNTLAVADIIAATSYGGSTDCLVRLSYPAPWMKTRTKVNITTVTGTTEANVTNQAFTYVSDTLFILTGITFVHAYTGGGLVGFESKIIEDLRSSTTTFPRRLRYQITGDPVTTWRYLDVNSRNSGGGVDTSLSAGPTTVVVVNIVAYNWELYSGNAYAKSCTFHEDRFVLAGGAEEPQMVSGSRTGDHDNFQPHEIADPVVASDPINISCVSEDADVIEWVISDEKGLLAGSAGSDFSIKSSSTTAALSPTNVVAKKTAGYGTKNIQPVRAGKSVIHAQANSKRLRELTYYYDVDSFHSLDLNSAARHILKGGVVQLAYQKLPISVVWAPRADGTLCALAYDREIDQIKASWARQVLGGYSDNGVTRAKVEAVDVIPSASGIGEDTYVIVKRYINGKVQRYVEYFTPIFDEEVDQQDGMFLDSGFTYDTYKTITGITNSATPTVTCTAHGFSNGDQVLLSDIIGMVKPAIADTELAVGSEAKPLNRQIANISSVATDSFVIDIDTTLYSAYVSGGEARKLVSTVTGLGHLEGETVNLITDGGAPDAVLVTNGTITLSQPAAVVHVGYHYNSYLKLLRIDAGSANGTAMGKTKRTHVVGLLLYRTLGLSMGPSFDRLLPITFDQAVGGSAPELTSGIVSETVEFNSDFDNQICIVRDQPLPATILAVYPQFKVEDGQ